MRQDVNKRSVEDRHWSARAAALAGSTFHRGVSNKNKRRGQRASSVSSALLDRTHGVDASNKRRTRRA
jgi:hypothetical protein